VRGTRRRRLGQDGGGRGVWRRKWRGGRGEGKGAERMRGAFVCVGMVGCRLGVELREKTGSTEPCPVAGSREDKASGGGG